MSGGKAVNVTSGSALTVRDAFIGAPKVTANVGGNLNIESLQDASSKRARDLEKSVKPADKPDSVHRHLLAKTPA